MMEYWAEFLALISLHWNTLPALIPLLILIVLVTHICASKKYDED